MVKCNKCSVELTNENWYSSYQIRYKNICIDCDKKFNKIKYDRRTQQQIDHSNTRHRENCRKNYIYTTGSDGKRLIIKTRKRPHTLICELCDKEYPKTVYHHWDDNHPEWGIWVCSYCHLKAEAVDNIEFIEKYKNLKINIQKGD